jgi:hypothetical protein
MRILASVIALAVALAWPNASDAQSHGKKSARSTAAAQHKSAPHRQVKRTRTTRVRTAARPARSAPRPCAGYLWWGCVGWDPDPNVRSTLVRDLADTP